MVKGVTKGYEKKLTLVGVGLPRAGRRRQDQSVARVLAPGGSRDAQGREGRDAAQTEIIVKGIDKQQVGQVAAEIRAYRPPEPYKGKGIRYVGEYVKIKETKKK